MSIYPSTKVMSYVYKLVHKTTKQFYIGYRGANKVSSSDDLGVKYFTSSKIVKPIFDQFDLFIIAEFFDKIDAHSFEQNLILENWNDPLILNKHYHTPTTTGMRQSDKQRAYARNRMLTDNPNKCPIRMKRHSELLRGRKASQETRDKMSITRTGKKLPKRPEQSAKMVGSGSPSAKKYVFLSPSGDTIIVTEGLYSYCKENKLGMSSMQKLSVGAIESYNGWTCVSCEFVNR